MIRYKRGVLLLVLWFLASSALGVNGVFQTSLNRAPLALVLGFALPIAIFTALYLNRGPFWEFCRSLDLRRITLVHALRLLGFLFLVRYAADGLPAGFALPAGIGDMAAGAFALVFYFLLRKKTIGVKRSFVAWNLFGLLDLLVAVGSGILYSASAFGVLRGNEPSTLIMSQFPLSLLPTFAVPLFILLHLLALARANEVAGS